jgi:hypothetical protein
MRQTSEVAVHNVEGFRYARRGQHPFGGDQLLPTQQANHFALVVDANEILWALSRNTKPNLETYRPTRMKPRRCGRQNLAG